MGLYVAIFAVSLVLRFWDLGTRVLHHDESIHAVWSYYIYIGKGYKHDPVSHGPFLYYATALSYMLIGAADYAVRLAPAIFDAIMVGLPYLLRQQLGRIGALATAAFIALSPSIVYYSRSLRHDIFAATGTFLLVVCLWRYSEDRQTKWLLWAAAALVLGFTTHELMYITVAILGFYLAVFTLPEIIRNLVKGRLRDVSPMASFFLV